jgi:predicted  nucleic acid-binding Zn-ribbon protein
LWTEKISNIAMKKNNINNQIQQINAQMQKDSNNQTAIERGKEYKAEMKEKQKLMDSLNKKVQTIKREQEGKK